MLTLPFGRHKGVPLADVPSGYLQWLLGACKLSSGLRAAVAGEVSRRGLAASVPPPSPEPSCPRGCGSGLSYGWMQDRLGRPRIRRSCGRCGERMGFASQVPPYTDLADAAASPTALLDVLTWCHELGIELRSDGIVADFATREDYLRAEPALRDRVAQCRATLGRLLGKRREAT